jgi:hypothetical protein
MQDEWETLRKLESTATVFEETADVMMSIKYSRAYYNDSSVDRALFFEHTHQQVLEFDVSDLLSLEALQEMSRFDALHCMG